MNKPSKRKRKILAIKSHLKELHQLKERNNYFKRNFIELTKPSTDYSLFTDIILIWRIPTAGRWPERSFLRRCTCIAITSIRRITVFLHGEQYHCLRGGGGFC